MQPLFGETRPADLGGLGAHELEPSFRRQSFGYTGGRGWEKGEGAHGR